MAQSIFDPPDADDTIRRSLPAGGGHNGAASANYLSSVDFGRDAEREIGSEFPPMRRPPKDYFDNVFGDDELLAGFEARPASAEPPQSRRESAIDNAFDLAALNPLVGAAAPLLWLAGRLNESAPPEDVGQFRERIVQEIRRFETAAMARNVPARLVRMGRYALAATLDDIILNTNWGGQSAWASRSLVSLLYNETWGGERFYDLLSQMRLNPDDNIDGLEFMAICLAVGFAGKYRVLEGGQGQLSRLRHDLYRSIRRIRGPYDRDLSPPWEAIAAPHAAPKSAKSAWIIVAVAALLVAALWLTASLNLRARVEAATAQIEALAPKIPVVVTQPAIPDIPEPRKPRVPSEMERLSAFLADDIAAKRVELAKTGGKIVIRMLNASFPSGGVTLAKSEEPLIGRIAAALDKEKGPIVVVGHTDNVPVPADSPLGDNMTISRKRAQSVANILQQHLSDPGRVSSEGRGSNEPIASNATAEGRSRNRRVEYWIDAEKGQ